VCNRKRSAPVAAVTGILWLGFTADMVMGGWVRGKGGPVELYTGLSMRTS
jgi:hypothetical protein